MRSSTWMASGSIWRGMAGGGDGGGRGACWRATDDGNSAMAAPRATADACTLRLTSPSTPTVPPFPVPALALS